MAEFIFKALVRSRGLEDMFYIESAAVSAEEIGNPVYPPARRCLAQHGVLWDSGKTARRVTAEDYRSFDLLVCMDRSNVSRLERITGPDTQRKVHFMMSYAGTGRDVADPWYTGDFEEAFQDILRGCEGLLNVLLA